MWVWGDNEGCCFFNDFYEYDPTTDVWSTLLNFNGLNRSFPGTVVVNGKGYMLGGESISGGHTNQMWAYDPTNDSWSISHNFSGVSRRYGALYYLDGTFYYGIGHRDFASTNITNDFWQFTELNNIDKSAAESRFKLYPNPLFKSAEHCT